MLSRRIRYKVYDLLSTNNAVVRWIRWRGCGGGFLANNIPESLMATWRNSLFFLLYAVNLPLNLLRSHHYPILFFQFETIPTLIRMRVNSIVLISNVRMCMFSNHNIMIQT